MEELVCNRLARQDGQTAAEVIEVPAVLGKRDELLGKRLNFCLALANVVWILPCSINAVARLRNSIRR